MELGDLHAPVAVAGARKRRGRSARLRVEQHQRHDLHATRYKTSDDWADAQTAGTESDGAITFTSGTDSFQIDLFNSLIPEGVALDAQSVGLVEESAIFEPRDDGTDPVLRFTLVNDDATAEAS